MDMAASKRGPTWMGLCFATTWSRRWSSWCTLGQLTQNNARSRVMTWWCFLGFRGVLPGGRLCLHLARNFARKAGGVNVYRVWGYIIVEIYKVIPTKVPANIGLLESLSDGLSASLLTRRRVANKQAWTQGGAQGKFYPDDLTEP